jgi:hypothetical protein
LIPHLLALRSCALLLSDRSVAGGAAGLLALLLLSNVFIGATVLQFVSVFAPTGFVVLTAVFVVPLALHALWRVLLRFLR